MKKIVAAAALAAAVFGQAQADDRRTVAEELKSDLAEAGIERFTGPDYERGTIRHIVLFRYKDGTSEDEREEIRRRFLALQHEGRRDGAPYIVSIETGEQASGEGVDGGFQDAFFVTFRSEGDRNYYVGTPVVTDPAFFDPAHQKFKEFVGPYLAGENGVLVFDYEAERTAD